MEFWSDPDQIYGYTAIMQNVDNFSVSGQNKNWFVTDSSSMCAVQYPITALIERTHADGRGAINL